MPSRAIIGFAGHLLRQDQPDTDHGRSNQEENESVEDKGEWHVHFLISFIV